MPPPPPTDDADCPECRDAAAEAAAKAKATPADGLRLGDCAPLYQAWADCIEREKGQAKACATVLKEFKQCHQSDPLKALPK
jgi:hypothetical protein